MPERPAFTAGGVDVLVPCYNYGTFLEACVNSVLQGTVRPVRILIADDCSTDQTPQIASALAARHPNVFYLRHARNIGHIATYNDGIQWATSAYFVLLSADDLVAPGAIERAADFLDTHPDVGLVYGRTHTFFGEAPARACAIEAFETAVVDGADFIRSVFADSHNPIASPASVMVRTALQQDIGGYRPELPHAGDLEMYLRFAARAAIGFLDIEQGLYRRHASNMSHGFQDLRDYAQRLAAFEAIGLNDRARLPDHATLLQRVRRTMALELVWAASGAFEQGAQGGASGIDEQLAFAATLDPSIRRARCWHSLRVKRMLGRVWARRAVSLLSRVHQSVIAQAGKKVLVRE